MNAVLADTGPLYALVDPDDSLHVRARSEAQRLREIGLRVLVGHPTVCEAYTLVLRRLGLQAARTWLDEVRTGCGLINPAAVHYDAAARRLHALSDQPVTLFDAVLAELAAHLDLPVWTYDHHFDLMQARVWR
jgi:predicted nucleic acid-binding protein